MRPDEYIGAITRQTSVLLNSANWNWWAQNAARTAGVSLARSALPVFCACHSYPSPDAGAPVRETLRLSAAGISRIPDDHAADHTRPPPGRAAVPGPRTTWSCRCVWNRGSGFRRVPASSEARVGYDPELAFGSFHPRTIRSPAPVDSDTDRPHPLVSPENEDRARAYRLSPDAVSDYGCARRLFTVDLLTPRRSANTRQLH